MATGTAGDSGYRLHTPLVHTIAKRVVYSEWTGTNNDAHVAGVLPPRAMVLASSGVLVITGFDDTNGDDLDVGVSGSDDDLFHSGMDLNTGDGVFTVFDDLADANRYSATARTVTYNFTTAPSGNGTVGEAIIFINYVIAPST